jgi:23S rRNA pseudouridine2605 synthase
MRINRFLAAGRPGSRRGVEDWIKAGRVKVNGEVCTDLARTVSPDADKVELDDKLVKIETDKIYLILNKPKGYITTASDPYGRKTVFDLIPDLGVRVFPVGRLDADTEGLLLFTNDGDLSNRLIHPRFKLPKIYRANVSGKVTAEQLKRLREGISLDDKTTQPARVYVKKTESDHTVLRIMLQEGMNRQIRRMAEVVGLKVTSLKRLQFAGIELGKLPAGMWRLLKPDETMALFRRVGRRK